MKKTLKVENKNITIHYDKIYTENKLPIIILNTFEEDGQEIWNKTKELTHKEYVLVSISNIDWNREMSPWYMDKLFKGEENYAGKADEYIEILAEKIIPDISKEIGNLVHKDISEYIIAGYSLAGLFAIYSLYKTNIFSSAISCSGSLWYPNFIEYIKENELKIHPNKIYFSLGNRESKTKNELMSKVEEKTKIAERFYNKGNIETVYEENEGNHFQDVDLRIAKGIAWVLEEKSMSQVIEIIVDNKKYQIEWALSEHFGELKGMKFMLNKMAADQIVTINNLSETAKILLSAVAGAVIQHLIDKNCNIDSVFENGYFVIK